MKTDDLIAALSRDAKLVGPSVDRRLTYALLAGAVAALAFLIVVIRPRPDLMEAMGTRLFVLKMMLLATLALAAIPLLRVAAQPEGKLPRLVLIVPMLLLLFGIGHEMATQLPSNYGMRLVGKNWAFCLVSIPVMSIVPLGGLLYGLTYAAPSDPENAGMLAGLAAGAVAATFYGIHCTDDSPFFVMTWYSIAIGLVMFTGRMIGRRVLAW